MKRVVRFDRRAWSLLRRAVKKSNDASTFWVRFYTFVLQRAGVGEQERLLFKNLGKRINPRAFKVTSGFNNKVKNLCFRVTKSGDYWANTNWGPSVMSLRAPGLGDSDVLITDEYFE